MLDRTKSPEFGKVGHFSLQQPVVHRLDNGIPVHVIDAGKQKLLKIELVFPAGDASAEEKLVPIATAALMEEGTEHRSGAAIADAMDRFGAQLHSNTDTDETAVTLYTLNKYLGDTLPVMAEMYGSPSFPQHELETYVRNQRQEAEVSEQKVGHLASRAFRELIYGTDSPLGRGIRPADYERLNRNAITDYYSERLSGKIAHIIVAGKMTDETLPLLNAHFGSSGNTPDFHTVQYEDASATPTRQHLKKEGAVQNAIRVGRVLFNRNHPDFVGMQFLSTALGGYFGSRLMTNIREDKGYTYGVSASLTSMAATGHLTISTEVGSDVCDAALTEIFHEMQVLREQPVSQGELETVKSYLSGMLLKGLDGPFALASKWRGYLKYGVGSEAHDDTLRQIYEMTPERLQSLASTYLREEDMCVVTAGK